MSKFPPIFEVLKYYNFFSLFLAFIDKQNESRHCLKDTVKSKALSFQHANTGFFFQEHFLSVSGTVLDAENATVNQADSVLNLVYPTAQE